MPTIGRTPNFALALPYGNRQNWTDLMNGNFRIIDALIATYVSVTNLQGLWANNTAYTVGDNVVDETSGVVYTAQVDHTSSSVPTTFLEERTNNPTYWLTFAVAARNRGAWQTATAYALNDFVLADGTKYAMAIEAHTSGANFTTDLTAGKWEVMIDLSSAGSLVLPVLSGLGDANKAVMSDSSGTSYIISSMTALASLLNAAGLATLANPTFSGNPTAPTATAEDNDTSLATTQYVDRAVRALIPRVQTFTASGTYTPHAKMVYCDIECVGGGGGGGGTGNPGASQGSGGGGGGGGGYSRKVATSADIGGSKTVTIGAAGTGGVLNAGGSAGGTTSVGTLCIANGGTGGGGSAGSGVAGGGVGGGTGSTAGDVIIPGQGGNGAASGTIGGWSGSGGHSRFGAGGSSVVTATVGGGGNGTGYGAGGSGAASFNGGGGANGGNGTAGFVCITEYCYG